MKWDSHWLDDWGSKRHRYYIPENFVNIYARNCQIGRVFLKEGIQNV